MTAHEITTIPTDDLRALRRWLHERPELSGEEYKTSEAIKACLEQCRPDFLESLGGTGLVAIFDSGQPGPAVLFRAELDALPIHEDASLDYRSRTDGIAHKCGHDGHATILIGLARRIADQRPGIGKAIILFQPAEETGEGATAILEDPKFAGIRPDYVFALHNIPGYPMHEIVVREGPFTASVKSLIISLKGKTAHAGEPENGINPAEAIANIVSDTAKLSNNVPASDEFVVITPVHIRMGEMAYGVSAGDGEVHLTIRTWTKQRMIKLESQIVQLVDSLAGRHQLEHEITWTHPFVTNLNAPDAVSVIRASAEELGLSITEKDRPFRWGEDFGHFTQRWPGAMFGLGAGLETPALHNPDYDFPDELISTGTHMFCTILNKFLAS